MSKGSMTQTSNSSPKDRRRAVLSKFYGGERLPWMHNFNEDTGVCENCSTFLGDALNQPYPRLCKVITPEEVERFRFYEG